MEEQTSSDKTNQNQLLENERYQALEEVKEFLEPFILALGFAWLVLLIVEFIWGSTTFTETLVWVIWIVFIIDFSIRFIIAPEKLNFLRNNWLTTISLFIPALRVLRLARVARVLFATRAIRSVQLLRVISSLNRGMRALRSHMKRRQFGYILGLSAIVTLVGAAAMLFFESSAAGGGFNTYWDALYWTGMMMTTLGSDYWPETGEARVLTLLLAFYAFTMLGYVTATLATFFIGREADSDESELAAVKSIEQLQAEVAALRADIHRLANKS